MSSQCQCHKGEHPSSFYLSAPSFFPCRRRVCIPNETMSSRRRSEHLTCTQSSIILFFHLLVLFFFPLWFVLLRVLLTVQDLKNTPPNPNSNWSSIACLFVPVFISVDLHIMTSLSSQVMHKLMLRSDRKISVCKLREHRKGIWINKRWYAGRNRTHTPCA